ncbi:SHQ1 protein-domain-containing protein [Lipomyces oligophaga]|uniref:SHQ1 protein-domain-containing protein n=1 Tax=Lipomyces oligophaga TaxID=45792 RepID=UPI0034CFB3B2
MITPQFSVKQDDEYVYIDIKIVHLKAQNAELQAEGDVFRFSLPPYYLRLHLPGNIVDDDRATASLDVGKSHLAVRFAKETPGEYFPDLDMITKLLARVKSEPENEYSGKPLIEEISPEDGNEVSSDEQKKLAAELDDAANFDWQIEQNQVNSDYLLTAKYGFDLQYSGFLRETADIGNDINDIDSPETSTIESRKQERIRKETEKFDSSYYLYDLLENEEISEYINYVPSFIQALKDRLSDASQTLELTDEETKQMMTLPRRTYLMDSIESLRAIYMSLPSLLFAYCYDLTTTMDEHTSESAWTIGKLSPTISCLDNSFSTIRQIQITCFRRALSYPLYRSWDLALKCWNDMATIMRAGKRAILKALLDINHLFAFHDIYYIYSKIVVEDYCVWIQSSSDAVLRSLASDCTSCQITKYDLDLDLIRIEHSA